MKVCTYKRLTPLGEFRRLGLFFNETTIIDPQFVWQKQFELEGKFNPLKKAKEICPESLSDFISQYQESSFQMLEETLEAFKELSSDGILKTNNHADLSFDLLDDQDVSLGCPLDKIGTYRDFYAHEKHVAKGCGRFG